MADPRPARPSEDFAAWVIRLGNKRTLQHRVTLAEIKAEPALRNWSFTKMQQGAMRWRHDVRQQEFWPPLRDLILRHNPGILTDRPDTPAPTAKRPGFQYAPYLSYDRTAELPIERIYEALSKELESYLDTQRLSANGTSWNSCLDVTRDGLSDAAFDKFIGSFEINPIAC